MGVSVDPDDLDNKVMFLIDTRYGDGINAGYQGLDYNNMYGVVTHSSCPLTDYSFCSWMITYCGMVEGLTGKEAMFSFESAYNAPADEGCFPSDEYGVDLAMRWVVYYAECNDRYYFRNQVTGTWMYAIAHGQVQNDVCAVENPLDTACGCYSGREIYFM